ncbi:MAG: hypothetical protein ABFS42_09870 [Candidatus Krumholzibacteriota bacterium]
MSEQEKQNPIFLVIPALLSLVFALVAGLIRLPWELPFGDNIAQLHGALMVSGFLGTVIAAERASALGRVWAWLAVAANGLGALMALAGGASPIAQQFFLQVGAALFVLGGIGLVCIFAAILRRETTFFNAIMGLGAVAYLFANLLLLAGQSIPAAVPFWSVFLVATIAGERLELNRFLRPRRGSGAVFGLAVILLAASGIIALFDRSVADRVMGFSFFVLGAWLIMNDIARRTVRMSGVTRYTAICLLSGYVWLIVSGLSLLTSPGELAGSHYDVNLHTLYVGFVLTMIFGHAPIIVPALTGKVVDYRGHFFLPLILLHASLLMRVGANHAQWLTGRRWGGLLNEVALLLFLGVMVAAVRRGGRESAG